MKELKKNTPRRDEKHDRDEREKKEQEQKIDEQLEQTFPASDPPSYSQPGNKPEEE